MINTNSTGVRSPDERTLEQKPNDFVPFGFVLCRRGRWLLFDYNHRRESGAHTRRAL